MPRAWCFDDNVSTDVITPGRYNVTTDPAELAQAAFREARPGFRHEVGPGDVVIAGANFGCGSSRESAPRALHASGIAGVVAESYARIFYRNAVNVGLPVVTAPGIRDLVQDGDEVRLDLAAGQLHLADEVVEVEGATGLLAEITDAGGIIPYVRSRGIQL